MKNCKIFIRNFEACVINASQFHNSADRLRFDLPTTEFTMNLNRNNQAVLAGDLGDVLLDLSVVLRYSIVYKALIMSHFEKIISKKICQTTWSIIAQAHPRFEPWSWHWRIHQIQGRHPKLTWCCTISCSIIFKHSGQFLKRTNNSACYRSVFWKRLTEFIRSTFKWTTKNLERSSTQTAPIKSSWYDLYRLGRLIFINMQLNSSI